MSPHKVFLFFIKMYFIILEWRCSKFIVHCSTTTPKPSHHMSQNLINFFKDIHNSKTCGFTIKSHNPS